jgi:hypothetical protein
MTNTLEKVIPPTTGSLALTLSGQELPTHPYSRRLAIELASKTHGWHRYRDVFADHAPLYRALRYPLLATYYIIAACSLHDAVKQ